jgi:hypothetical protein
MAACVGSYIIIDFPFPASPVVGIINIFAACSRRKLLKPEM